MRVAFVVPETVHHRSTPTARRLDRVVHLLLGRGNEVTVFCPRWWGSSDVEEFEKDGVTYRAVSGGRRQSLALPLALRRFEPDVIHVDGSTTGAVKAAAYGSTVTGAPVVGEWYERDPRTGDGPAAVSRVDHFVAPSDMVRTRLREAGANGGDVSVIPDPVVLDELLSTSPDDEYADDVVYAGALDGTANLESLLLALAELRGFDWRATVVGDGPARADYERQVRDLRIDDRVRFVGELDRTDRTGVYRAARAFVQTATECVFPTELLWALACGCVGIVEYHAGSSAHELLEGRDRGFRATTETELVEALQSVSECDRQDFDEEFAAFDEDAVLERYLACYREVLGGSLPR